MPRDVPSQRTSIYKYFLDKFRTRVIIIAGITGRKVIKARVAFSTKAVKEVKVKAII